MLGKAILMTAHALGIVTILGCAALAQQSLSPTPAAAPRLAPTDLAGSGRAAPVRGGQ